MGEDTPKDPCETCRYHGFENEFCGTCCSQTDHYALDKSVELAKLREEVKRLQAKCDRIQEALKGAADYLASAADAFRNGCKQLPTEVIDAYWRKVDELRALASKAKPEQSKEGG